MREIKFRGKRVDNGEWVYGDLNHVGGFGTKHVQIYRDSIDEQHSPEVDPETVGQFTGLKDKDGVDIYEGDIVSGCNGSINGVAWPTGNIVIVWRKEKAEFNVPLWGDFVNQNRTHWFKIIGNIHENPELLK